MKCDNVKWYPDYQEIKAFDNAVENFIDLFCADTNCKGGYEFVRIGEEYNDIETESEGDVAWLLSVYRSVEVNLKF